MKPDLTDMGIRIVSWSNRGTMLTLDPAELREKTAALVAALKALEAAAEAMPPGLHDVLSLRVDVYGQTIIGGKDDGEPATKASPQGDDGCTR
jgi:hypothetical protein